MTRLSVCGLGVSCNEMNDTPMLLVVQIPPLFQKKFEPPRNEILDTPLISLVICFTFLNINEYVKKTIREGCNVLRVTNASRSIC